MAEIRCPNCGKSNPSHVDLCQFCYTRLKPTGELPPASSDDLLSLLGGQAEESEVPDWLESLRPDVEVNASAEASAADETLSTLPEDWQAQLGLERLTAAEEGGEPSGGEETGESAFVDRQAYEETLDWLSSLDEQPLDSGSQAPPPASSSAFIEGSDLDWFSQAEEPEQPEQPISGAETPSPSGEEEWLADLKREFASDIGEETPSAFDFQPESEAEAEQESADWLARLGTEAAESIPTQGEQEELEFSFQDLTQQPGTGDWSEEESPPEFQPSETPSEPEEQPDWLERLGEQDLQPKTPEGETPFVSPFTEDVEEFLAGAEESDWFSASRAPVERAAPAMDEEIPEWLREAGEGTSPFGSADEKAEALPDQSLEQPMPGASFEEGIPDWLSETAQRPSEETLVEPTGEAQFATFEVEGEELPDWLSKLEGSRSETSETASVPAFILDEELPPFGGEEAAEEITPVGAGETPDWLDQITLSQELPPLEKEEAEPRAEEEPLMPAELPGWLEAMRPSESGTTGIPFRDTTDDRVEKQGFLAGLPGVLAAEYDLEQVKKPPTYTLKLQVPPDQQARLDLLKAMLSEEEQVIPPPKPAQISAALILRLLILGAFILGVIFAFWAGVQQTPQPGLDVIPQPALDLSQAVKNLPDNAPVLIAFDYEPSSIPELETAALGVVDLLVSKGSHLRTVSTNQTGPALAKLMLQRVAGLPTQPYPAPLDVAFLGYIPGGPAGLQAFGRDPANLMRYDLNSTESTEMDAWKPPVFNPQAGLANFKLVLVITDNAESARGWIEQVGSRLMENQIPLVMIVSAQIEPLVLPYYFATPRQVNGVASGVMGGVFLENLAGHVGPAITMLDAYSLMLAVAAGLLLIGSLIYLVTGQLHLLRNLRSEGQA